jgi:uncharacterized Zn-binding protein involved in type VI secretion
MLGVARVTDRTDGTCRHRSHKYPVKVGGTIIVGDPVTFADGLPVARIGDTVMADCGHTSVIVTGSPSTKATNIPFARLGDSVNGDYVATIISASSVVFAEG